MEGCGLNFAYKIGMTGIKQLLPFTLLVLLLSMASCVDSPDSFYQNDMMAMSEDEVFLSLETAPDGKGEALSSLSVNCTDSQNVFAVLREVETGVALASLEVEWSSDELLLITEKLSSVAQIIGAESGETSLTAHYAQEDYQLTAT